MGIVFIHYSIPNNLYLYLYVYPISISIPNNNESKGSMVWFSRLVTVDQKKSKPADRDWFVLA
jgi:hypothetical protein